MCCVFTVCQALCSVCFTHIISLNPHNPMRSILLSAAVYRVRVQSSERLRKLPGVMQPAVAEVGYEPRSA